MDTEEKKKLYVVELARSGADNRKIMLLEEMAELSNEIAKSFRDRTTLYKIVDEIADVRIMLEQVEMLYSIESEVEVQKEYKLNRLKNSYITYPIATPLSYKDSLEEEEDDDW